MVFNKIRKAFSTSDEGGIEDEYLEIDLEQEEKENKVVVRLFRLHRYEEVNEILNALREGYTIAIIDIKPFKQRVKQEGDHIELKRAISKIKKTTEALEGSIAGLGDFTIIVTPSFAKIHKQTAQPKQEKKSRFD